MAAAAAAAAVATAAAAATATATAAAAVRHGILRRGGRGGWCLDAWLGTAWISITNPLPKPSLPPPPSPPPPTGLADLQQAQLRMGNPWGPLCWLLDTCFLSGLVRQVIRRACLSHAGIRTNQPWSDCESYDLSWPWPPHPWPPLPQPLPQPPHPWPPLPWLLPWQPLPPPAQAAQLQPEASAPPRELSPPPRALAPPPLPALPSPPAVATALLGEWGELHPGTGCASCCYEVTGAMHRPRAYSPPPPPPPPARPFWTSRLSGPAHYEDGDGP